MHPFRAAIETGDLDALPDLLAEDVRFLSPVAFAPYDGRPVVSARGFFGGSEAEYVRLLIDGVPSGDVESGLIDWSRLPLAAIRRVEAARGPGASFYGDAAIGEFSWHELATDDYKSATNFYRALFKWEKTSDYDMGESGIYSMFGQGGQVYGGVFNRPPEIPAPNWLCYIRVEDVKRTADKIKQLGGSVMTGPMEVPGGDWIAQCMDPQGATFAIHAK